MARSSRHTAHDLFPGRTFDPITRCWVKPGEKPVSHETMVGYQEFLDDLHERMCRAQLAADPDANVPSYTCPFCAARSWNPGDIKHRYCGRCHRFADDRIDQAGGNL